MDWINRGILDIVFQAILRNGNTESSYNTVPIKIAKHLLTDNEEGCKIFGYNYIKVLDGEDYSSDSECVGIYQSIYVLTGIEAFRKVIMLIYLFININLLIICIYLFIFTIVIFRRIRNVKINEII